LAGGHHNHEWAQSSVPHHLQVSSLFKTEGNLKKNGKKKERRYVPQKLRREIDRKVRREWGKKRT
jgi:hypothetical protein